jgi:ferredoxin
LCILCERYGEGDLWYKNPKNFARRLYGLPKKGSSTAVGRIEEVQALELIKSVIDTKDTSLESFNQQLQGIKEMLMQNPIGQVVPLQDVLEIVDILYPIAKIDCVCRRLSRATQENPKTYSCMGTGLGMYKWERWPERYKGGVEFTSPSEAKDFLRKWNKKGMVHTVMIFGAPYIGGICNCDYPDCIAIRQRLDYDLQGILLKGHYVAKVNYEECKGCGTCISRCQFGAVKKEVTTNKANIDMFKCFGCGLCETACPKGAITLVKRTSLSALRNVW